MSILHIELMRGREMSTWELCLLLKHRLQYKTIPLSYSEADTVKLALTDYQRRWEQQHTLTTTAALPTLHDRRAEVLMAECVLAHSNADNHS